MNQHSCFVVSNKPHIFPQIQNSLESEPVTYFDGQGFDSFSRLVNCCVASASTEIVVVMSDKVRPTKHHVRKIVDLVQQGFGLVGLYRFGFFGFKKQLMRQIGMFDERYVGGGYEDDDMYIRLKEANIALYITQEVEYEKSRSSWDYARARPHFEAKWLAVDRPGYDPTAKPSAEFVTRRLPEQTYHHDLGPAVPTVFLPWHRSVIATNKAKKYI
jgi:hypothetical protein